MLNVQEKNPSTLRRATSLTYNISNDPALLAQYYHLRDKEYHNFLHIEGNIAKEDYFDKEGIICLAFDGEKVIGGARLSIVPAHSSQLLPMEDKDFLLKTLLPPLSLDNHSYCEISRFVIDPAYRKGNTNLEITRRLIGYAQQQGCTYHFSIAPKATSINSRRIGKMIGVNHQILYSIEVPYKPLYKELNEKGIFLSCTILFPEGEGLLTKSDIKALDKKIFIAATTPKRLVPYA